MKQPTLKTKWTLVTTVITFLIIFIFCLLIIYAVSSLLKQHELEDAEHSADELYQLLANKPLKDITPLDFSSVTTNHQKVILYDRNGTHIMENENASDVQFIPEFEKVSDRSVRIIKNSQGSFIIVSNPIHTNHFKGYSTIIHPLDVFDDLLNFITYLALIFGLIALFVTATISYAFSAQITQPINIITDKMTQIRRNGFQEKLEVPTSYEETDALIDNFNSMMMKLEDAFNQQRQFVEDASHELRTPLQIIQGHLNLIQRWGKKDPAVLEESLTISLEEMNRITKLVEELLLLTKDDPKSIENQIEQVDVNLEIKNRLNSLKQIHPDYQFEFETNQDFIYLNMNAFHLEQILLIFIDNAIKYDQENRHICIKTKHINQRVLIEIKDHGMGIPKEDQEHIFNRFYRVDKSRSRQQGGNGLGLSIALKMVKLYDGHITVNSEEGSYTIFTISFNSMKHH
ncbi:MULTISPECIES: HAMP domain-containing histidine kinase [unclassified Staphylococcus]|uniref:sensor histidine kinase n=1 Tax=unclassified Staphylococcus TaxID=91994 RepID=UPI0021CFC8C9|nr:MULTISPECIES: HAMP domain-containing histidine kinase [unclassified Staphylococcus]UXR68776.1 HAMP domain-containing histidine kinase [Staphylococcus sp. IVB6246]UXR70833.1 HAMP domain-containing histidine kinase [Staphylococcus sp. IVB6240]UXR73063.1 HAMP domain-containing histidine kinase [Staphylococcus sp. IVB6238]UXR75360.1 HAMP domain-containing histidine kinase [Staphylococcus sp. IVB6233]UXR79562.1 HAMP domain-containing histidine kinase [Staphylococcus sp. IVB6218]